MTGSVESGPTLHIHTLYASASGPMINAASITFGNLDHLDHLERLAGGSVERETTKKDNQHPLVCLFLQAPSYNSLLLQTFFVYFCRTMLCPSYQDRQHCQDRQDDQGSQPGQVKSLRHGNYPRQHPYI